MASPCFVDHDTWMQSKCHIENGSFSAARDEWVASPQGFHAKFAPASSVDSTGRRNRIGPGILRCPLRARAESGLDPVLVSTLVDEIHHHFGRRSSSAWPKNADALRKISFARLSSRFSRSSSLSRSRSAVVSPGRFPESRSAACPARLHCGSPGFKRQNPQAEACGSCAVVS
jgi:hypothetical protein